MIFTQDEITNIRGQFGSFEVGTYTLLKLKSASKIHYLIELRPKNNRFLVRINPNDIEDNVARQTLSDHNPTYSYAIIDMRDQSFVHFIGAANNEYALRGDMTRI